MDRDRLAAAATTLRHVIADLEIRAAHPQHYRPEAHELHLRLLRERRLELRDLEDQLADPGDLP